MLNHGVPVIIVSRRLGHSKVSMTLDIYGHMFPEMQNEAAEMIDNLITPIEVEIPKNNVKECLTVYGYYIIAPDLHQILMIISKVVGYPQYIGASRLRGSIFRGA
jgi:hypothetical protein